MNKTSTNQTGGEENKKIEMIDKKRTTPERQKELEEIYKQAVKSLPTKFKGPAPKMWFTGNQEDWDNMDPEIKNRFENEK